MLYSCAHMATVSVKGLIYCSDIQTVTDDAAPAAVQAWRPCRLWEPSPNHPIVLLQTRGLCLCVCVSLYCVAVVCALCVFWVFCSVFSFSILILLVGSFVSHITCAVLVETLNTAQSINQCLH